MTDQVSTLEFLAGDRARQERGISQDELAKEINYSGSLVGMVEIARRTPSRDFARRADDALQTGGLLTRLLTPVDTDTASAWFKPWVAVEQEVTALWWYEVSVLPGLLQTEEYARAVLHDGGLVPEDDLPVSGATSQRRRFP